MSIEIKKSQKPVKYEDALKFMEKRLLEIDQNKSNDLIWTLEHEDIYTAGTTYKENEVLDKSIKILKTNRGGKITYHGPGQLICYFVIDLKKGKKDIRKFISNIEKTIIETLKYYQIDTFPDKDNIGVRYNDNSKINLYFALGKAYEDTKNYEKSFSFIKKANDQNFKNIVLIRAPFKENTDDLRDSPSLKIYEKINKNYKNIWILEYEITLPESYQVITSKNELKEDALYVEMFPDISEERKNLLNSIQNLKNSEVLRMWETS